MSAIGVTEVDGDIPAPPDDPPRPLPAWRKWVEERLANEAQLRDALLEVRLEKEKREHLKTRAWVLLVTAPAWGKFASDVFTGLSTVEGTVGGMVAVLAGSGLLLLRGVIRGGVT